MELLLLSMCDAFASELKVNKTSGISHYYVFELLVTLNYILDYNVDIDEPLLTDIYYLISKIGEV